MKIYLVRHAHPVEPDVDADRPLSQRGRAEARLIAEHLAQRGDVNPVLIMHSGQMRSAQTAQILEQHLHPAGGNQPMPGLDPGDDTVAWEIDLATFDEDMMIVGHMPFIGRLVFDLCRGRTGGWHPLFGTSEVACLERVSDGYDVCWRVAPADLDPA